MNDEIKEIIDCLELAVDSESYKILLNYITNLQQENERLKENNQDMQEELARTWQKCDDLQQEIDKLIDDKKGMLVQLYKANDEKDKIKQENERLKAQLTDTEWQLKNTRFKYEKQYKKGITEELLEDIETCFFNRKNPSMIPIDSLDLCHIFGYIDYLKDYKSRCEKADNQLKIIMQIIKEQPTRNVEDDEWIENRLIGVVNILQNRSDTYDNS